MKGWFVAVALVFAASTSHVTQSSLTDRWRAVVLLPNGGTPEWSLNLRVDGATVTADVTGAPFIFRDGRLDGSTLTLAGVSTNSKAEVTFTGQVAPNDIVFRATGLFPEPFYFVARRDTRVQITGSVSDPAVMLEALKRFDVPGVSIAIIKDFKVVLAVAYGVADAGTGTPVTTSTMFQAASISKPVAAMVSLKAVQAGRFALDQDINSVLTSWKLPEGELTKSRKVTPRALMSHTSGTGDAFGFPGTRRVPRCRRCRRFSTDSRRPIGAPCGSSASRSAGSSTRAGA